MAAGCPIQPLSMLRASQRETLRRGREKDKEIGERGKKRWLRSPMLPLHRRPVVVTSRSSDPRSGMYRPLPGLPRYTRYYVPLYRSKEIALRKKLHEIGRIRPAEREKIYVRGRRFFAANLSPGSNHPLLRLIGQDGSVLPSILLYTSEEIKLNVGFYCWIK